MSQDINKVECIEKITKDCYCYVCIGGAFRRVKVSNLLSLADGVTTESIAAALGYTPADPKKVEASGTAAKAITAHNTEKTAHNDIRLLIEELESKLNGQPDSSVSTVEVPVRIEADLSTIYTPPDAYRYSAPITNIMKTPEGFIGYKIDSLGAVATAGATVKFAVYAASVSDDNTCTLTRTVDLGEAVADNKGIAKFEVGGYFIDYDHVVMVQAESASIGCLNYGTRGITMYNLPILDDENYYNVDEISCNLTTKDSPVGYGSIPIVKYCKIKEQDLNEYVYDHEKAYYNLNKKVTDLLPVPTVFHNGMFVQVVDGKYDLVAVTNGNEVKY